MREIRAGRSIFTREGGVGMGGKLQSGAFFTNCACAVLKAKLEDEDE